MPLQRQQEQARQLINAAQLALDKQEWATALDSAGRAILHWPYWREPFALIAQVCCLRGDAAMGQSYLQLALDHAPAAPPSPGQALPNTALSDADMLQQRFAQWCRDGTTASAATTSDDGHMPDSLQLVAGGDVMLGRQMPGWVGLRGAADPLSGIAATFKSADLSLVNLETCISTEGDFLDKGGRQPYYYHAHPEMLEVLIQAGVRCLVTGNNHAMDYGAAALAQQTDTLDACGFLHFGAGRNRFEAALPKYARVKGITIAFIGVETETPVMAAGDTTPGVHHVAIDQLGAVLAGSIAIARACADIVLVSPHWGENWLNAPSAAIERSARQLIELGADAVLGHSAHILQGVALHLGRPIIYDMGTLLFDRVAQHNMKDSALFALTWHADGACTLDIRPVKLSNARTRFAAGDDFDRICSTLTNLSQALDPALAIEQRETGLHLRSQPRPSLMRRRPGQPPAVCHPTQNPLSVPPSQCASQSNLIYRTLPTIDGIWPEPLQVNPNLTILGARYAGPVRAGRGFVCEVYFRASAPAMPSRVEARIAALKPDGTTAFAYTHPVAEGIHPPARWQPAQIICDRIVVRPVALAAPGSYKLCWSLVDMEGGQAMPVETAHERLFSGQVHIGDLQVSESAPQGVAGISTEQKLLRAAATAPGANLADWLTGVTDFWQLRARPWVAAALSGMGVQLGAEQPRVLLDGPLRLVLQLQTTQGQFYFKALASHNHFEPALTAFLAARFPDRVACPLAVCAEQAWMLTPDCGVTLRNQAGDPASETLLREAVAMLAEIQINTCADVAQLLAMGVPDRRLAVLPDMFERLLHNDAALNLGQAAGLTASERQAALHMLPAMRGHCAALAAAPCATGLDHGDMHRGNVLVRDGKALVFDWDTAWVTHPFCSMMLLYHASGLRSTADLASMASLGQAYLQPWVKHTGLPFEQLTVSLHLAIWLAHAKRALMWAALPEQTETLVGGQTQTLVVKWIRLWLERMPLLTETQAQLDSTSRPLPPPKKQPPKLASADNPLLLDAASMAAVTEGSWHALPEGALLTGVSFNRKYITEGSAGNLYFAVKADIFDETFDAASVAAVLKALKIGAAAAVVPTWAQGLPSDIPVLRVDHLMTAVDQLGLHVRDHLFTGKRVLVSGTEGKTGFKNMLRHALSPQISTHATTHSSNLGFAIMGSLASIRQKDRIAIIEAAGTHPGKLALRSDYVRPHLFVLTEVGNEHLNFHGSQQAVIESKADIVTGLVDGGYGLLNADSRNYAAVRRAVLARKRVPLLLFGSAPGCNGRLLDQRFANNSWTVSADIEGQQLQYTLAVTGEHIPLASVSVLLAAYYLGADVAQAAADLASYQPYETQGVLRRIAHRGGELLCYDNASRASVLSYQSALRMAARLHPPAPTGKRIAVIGQMIFLGQESEKWHAELAGWVAAAGFDCLILVGKYTEVTYANLPDPARVVRRFPDYDRRTSSSQELQALIAAVDEVCAPGDLLFVKGEVDELGLALQARQLTDAAPAATPPTAAAATPATVPAAAPTKPTALIAFVEKPDVSVLAGLRTLQLADITRYRAAIDQTQRTVWQHYFPFIYLLGQSPGHKFLVEEDAGSFCIYMLREKKDGQHLNVFLLPMPMQPAVLARCIERVKAFSHGERVSLFRVDAEDAKAFRSRPNTRVVTCEQEYIYAPANYLDLSGGKSGKLRREINSVLKHGDLEVLDYQTAFAAQCQQVLARWAAIQRQKYGSVHYEGFTNACLKQYDQFGRADLFGKVLRLNGQICSFGFGGEMRQGMGNIFIVYSDMQLHALSRFMNYTLLLNMQHLALANAAHAGDTPGLAAAKQAMLPVLLHQPYQVYAG